MSADTLNPMLLPESEAVVISYVTSCGTDWLKQSKGDSALPEWFGLSANKAIYRAVETLEKHGVIPSHKEVIDQLKREGAWEAAEPCMASAIGASGSATKEIAEQEMGKISRAYIQRTQSSIMERALMEKWSPSLITEKLEPLATLEQTGKGSSLLDGINVFNATDLIDKPIDEGQTLLGNRFLCRGGGMFLVGPSGVGKSTLTLGLAAAMGAGRAYLGIKPAKPLKILIIQAENDEGDVIEQMRGAYGLDRTGIENVQICPIGHLVGADLITALDRLIKLYKPDLVILDCLHAYLGDDAKESRPLGTFLRELLNPVIKRHGVGTIIVHHTPKTTNQDRTNWNPSDYQYAAAGCAEIANWTRSMLVLEATAIAGVFRLVAGKRGSRIGGDLWRNEWIPIRHSAATEEGMPTLKWEVAEDVDLSMIQRAALEKKSTKASYQCTAGDFLDQLPEDGKGLASCMKSTDLREILQHKKFCSKNGFASLKAVYVSEGIVKEVKLGTSWLIGRPEDIDEATKASKS